MSVPPGGISLHLGAVTCKLCDLSKLSNLSHVSSSENAFPARWLAALEARAGGTRISVWYPAVAMEGVSAWLLQ